jgi:crotonobetainyl-CoA:carnitine CoA-transferase CaiB-like acyl-CoA transferase
LTAHPDYATNADRIVHRDALEAILAEVLAKSSSGNWSALFLAAGVPCSPVRTFEEVYHDPQTAVRRMFQQVDGFPITGLPIKTEAGQGAPRGRAPKLGEHSREVLLDLLGEDEHHIQRLLEAGIILEA